MSLGIIARCDAGGLGTITREVFRHMQPARTLLVDLADRGRGNCAEHAYDVEGPAQSIYRANFAGGLPTRAIEWLAAPGIDTIWTAETLYDDRILSAANANGIRVIVYAMPELAPWATTAPGAMRQKSAPRPELWIPTDWRAETLPTAELVPMPIARDRLPYRERTKVEHLFHVTGAAMLDRNGTDLLLRALAFVEHECRLTIRSERTVVLPPSTGRVHVEVVYDRTDNYWDGYPDDIDLLVMPRRYGGLCLPVQECASLGVPALMLNTDPYASAPFVATVDADRSRPARMKGGRVPVFDTNPQRLARAIDERIESELDQSFASRRADHWASERAWSSPSMVEAWCSRLGTCEGIAA